MKYWVIYANDVATNIENGLEKVIKKIHWRRKFVDGLHMVEEFNFTELPEPDPSTFTPYENLTFDDYCNWVESIEDVVAMDQRLEEAMQRVKNPQVLTMNLPFDNIAIDQEFERIANTLRTHNIDYGTSGI